MKLSRVELLALRRGKARDSRIFADRRRSIGRTTIVDVEVRSCFVAGGMLELKSLWQSHLEESIIRDCVSQTGE